MRTTTEASEASEADRAGSGEERDLLPYVAQEHRPGPIFAALAVCNVDGIPTQLHLERWRLEDAWACPHADAIRPDPGRPGEGFVHWAVSLKTGSVCLPLSEGEIAAWPRGGRRDSRREEC